MYPMIKMNQFCKLGVWLWTLYVGPAERKGSRVFGGVAVVKVLASAEALKQTLEMFTEKIGVKPALFEADWSS